jgi:hypothetical protein
MPPRRSARVAAVAERASSALSPLPHAIVLDVFARLPVDERARCACVCRGWRAVMREPSLWTRLDLSPSSGVRVRVTGAVLQRASGLARGTLQALDVSGCDERIARDLLAVLTANAGALSELRVCHGRYKELSLATTGALLRAAPRLRVCDADACGNEEEAQSMLRNEPPFAPLRRRSLHVRWQPAGAREDVVRAFTAAVAGHASLSALTFMDAPLHLLPALDAVVDAVLARRLRMCSFTMCGLSAASAPALARLIRAGDALKELCVSSHPEPLLDPPAAALLASALRDNGTLTSLSLTAGQMWDSTDATSTLLDGVLAHASLRSLQLRHRAVDAPRAAAAGRLLAALVAANAPALLHLELFGLRFDALAPLFDALRRNTHLRVLECDAVYVSEASAERVLLPALRANASLHRLVLQPLEDGPALFFEAAMALVNARAAAA